MATQTPNFSFDLPDIGADSDAWGAFLNDNWTSIDTILATFVPESGGTFSGEVTYTLPVVAAAAPTLDTHLTNKLFVDTEVGVVAGDLTTHEGDTGNPHGVTAAQALALALAGGTMTGQITLPGGGAGLEAATVGELVTELNLKADVLDPVFIGVVTTVDLFITGVVSLKLNVLLSNANITLSMDDASKKTIALATDTIITVEDEVPDQTVEVWITQTGSGGTASWIGVDKWIGGIEPVLSTVIGQIDIILLTTDLTDVIGQHIGVAS